MDRYWTDSDKEDERFVANMDSCEAWSDEEEQLEPPDALYEFPVTEENGVIEAYTLNGDTVKNSKYLPMPAASTRAPFANPLLSKKLQRWHLNKLNPSLLQKNETGASAFYTSSSITPDSKIFSRNVVNSNSRSSSIFAGTEEDRKVSSIAGGRPSVVVYQNKLYAAGDVSDDSTSDSDNEELESDGGVEKAVKSSCGGVNLAGDMAGCGYSESLAFDAEFEGGNVDKVCRVFDRGDFPDFASVPPKASAAGSRARDSRDCPMVKLDQEYDLSLRKDIYTAGNMQWFHFSVSTSEIVKNASDMGVRLDNYRDSGSRVRHYPFTVRFNIINFLKKDSLFNYGMKISTYSHKNASEAGKAPGVKQRGSPQAYGSTSNSTLVAFDQVTDEVESVNHESWTHGGENICYYRNGQCITRKKRNGGNVVLKKRALYTLTFTYTFTGPDCVHFAYCCPYTYTDLQLYLQKLERNEQVKVIMRRQKLCDTLMGNRCDLLTICEPTLVPDKPQTPRPAIVVTGRIHPGEANASHAMQGFIDFITSPDNVQAYLLRKMFVFKIVPMLNPDGVIHGNNRCSLAGTDLNRRYLDADPYLHPTIHAVKHLVLSLQESRGVFLYIDLHGHSRKKNSFLYGCDIHLQSDKYMARIPKMSKEEYDARRVYPRIFPKLLCSMSNALKPGRERSGVGALPRDREEGYFSWKDCCFMVQKSKAGTGRVVMWRKCLVESAYTIELSYCGNGNNNEAGLIKKYASLPVLASISNQVMASQLNPNSVSNVKSKTDDNAMEGNAPSASEQHLSYAAVVEDLTKIFASHYLIPNNTKSECRNSRKVQDQDNSTSKTFSKYHYSIADYHNIGLDIGIAMFQFANLTEANVASACENKPSVSANALGKRVSSNVGQTSGNNSLGSNVDDADKCSNARYTSAADIPTLRESHLVYLEHTSGSDRKKLFAQNDVDKDGPIAEETTQESNSNANTASSTISATKSKTRKMKKKKKIKKKSTLGEEEAPISVVELVGSRALDAPLTTATVFTGDAFRFATSKMNSNKCEDDKTKFPREHIEAVLWKLSSRLQVEWKVRKALQIQFPEENGCVSSAFQVSEDEQEDCGDGDGSDSDPSVDNLPVQRVLQRSKNNFERLNEKSNRNSETMLSYIKKKLMKSRKNDKKSSTEKPLKSSTGQNSATASKEGIARLGGPNTVNPPTSNVVPRSTLAIKANPKPNFSSVKFEQEVVNTNCIADKPPLFLHVRNISLDVLDSFVEIPEPPTGAVAGAPSPTGISKKSVSATDSNSAQTSTSSSTASQFYRGHAISTNSARTRRDSTVTPASLRNSLASSMAVLPDHSNSSKDSVDNQPRPSRPSSAGGLSERLGGTCNRKRNTDTNSVTSTTGLSMVSTTSSGSVLMSNNRYVQLKDTNRSAMSTASHDNEKDTKLYVTTHVLSKQHVQSNSHTILRPTLGAQSAENSKTASVINNLIDPNSCSRTARASRGSSSTTSYNKLPPTWSPSTGSSIRKSIPLNSNKQSSTSTPRESRIGSSRASSTSPAPTSSAVDDKDTNNKSFGAIYGALGNKFKRSELFLDSETQFEEEVVVHSSKQHTLLTSMLVDKDNIDSGLSNNAILPVLRTGHSKDKPKVLI